MTRSPLAVANLGLSMSAIAIYHHLKRNVIITFGAVRL